MCYFFFFKQKTAYEMRISDWSSDVCSSDLGALALRGARVRVALLDDGNSPDMEALAARHGVRYVRRSVHVGAKAGNINHALRHVHAPYVAVFDCDHVPAPDFLERCLGHFDDERVALRSEEHTSELQSLLRK